MWRLKIGEGNEKDPYLFSSNNFVGRQTWEFDPKAGTAVERAAVEEARRSFFDNRSRVKASSDLLWRMQFLKEAKFEQVIPPVKICNGEGITYEKATNALPRGVALFSALQDSDGHWPTENSGPLFFLPPLNEDGGWGLHIESKSVMFSTVLNYICLRMLGLGPDGGRENACKRSRQWILSRGGVTYIPSWGKVWLAVNLLDRIFDWSGTNPMPPEIWLLPSFLPVHLGFAMQALLASDLCDETYDVLRRGHDYIKRSQVISRACIATYPKPKGAWTLSDRDHGWQVSDCTAEALKCCMLLSMMPADVVGQKMNHEHLYNSVDLLLTLQVWKLGYLLHLRHFALSGLATVGKTYNNSPSIRKGVDFLLMIQNDDGGWGESYMSCNEQRYILLEGNGSNLVQTAWAMMGLIHVGQV
ncbi:unnamed protein product [Microthlaspi erraticum]|uniref:Squalene cyclase N-terminal domain-containing protein n=1 Tax=Microthlaspi erraticum TaxID=1685480 RepID=A0A6D2HM67_9BRAS|nr:unnamed protein product [Microthlaspi erraticum]